MNLFKEQGVKDYLAAAAQIPVIDFGPYFGGERGALQRLAAQVRDACENIGFFYVLGHGVDEVIIDRAFSASRRFHALPLDQKLEVKLNENNIGYLPVNALGAGGLDRAQGDSPEPERELLHQSRSHCRPPRCQGRPPAARPQPMAGIAP